MAGYATVGDIVNDALQKAGELTDGSSEYVTRALDYLNDWHRDILAGSTELDVDCGDPWYWARAQFPAVINLNGPYNTGGVTVTQGSTAGTFGTAPTTSLANQYLKVDGSVEYFRIAAHLANGTAFTLDATYTSDSVTLGSFNVYKLEYTLATGILRLVAPFRVYRRQSPFADDSGQIDGIDKMSLDRDYPMHRMLSGVPDRFAVTWMDNVGNIRVRFNRVPATLTRCEYEYIPIPATLSLTDAPLLPVEHRDVLAYSVAYGLCVDKNDNRAAEYKDLAARSLRALADASRKIKMNEQKEMGRLIPRRDLTNFTRRYFVQEVTQ